MIPARSTKTIEQSIIDDINENRPDFDLVSGPLNDVVVTPQTNLIKKIEDDIEHASELTSLKYVENFSNEELDDFASTWGLSRLQGTKANTVIAFVAYTQPTGDITIPAGTVVQMKTTTDEDESYPFITTEEVVYKSYEFDRLSSVQGNSRKWIFTAPAEASVPGKFANGIQPRRLTELLGGNLASSIDQVYNSVTTKSGTDVESNEHFANRIISIMGYGSVLHPAGLKKYLYDQFPDDIHDISVQKGNNVSRVPNVKQAVDIYVIGGKMKNQQELFVHDGSREYVLGIQPVIEIGNAATASVTFENGVDYLLSKDYPTTFMPGLNNFTQEGSVAGSIKSGDSLVWNINTGGNVPAIGDSVTVDYVYNKLIHDIQTEIDNSLDFISADILVREGVEVAIYTGFTVSLKSNSYKTTDVYDNMVDTITRLLNVNEFGDGETVINTDDIIDELLKDVSGINSITMDYFNKEKHLAVAISNEIALSLKRSNKTIELKWNYGINGSQIIATDSVKIYRSVDNGLSFSLIDTITANNINYWDEPDETNLVYKIEVDNGSKIFDSNIVNTYSEKNKLVEKIVLKEYEYSIIDAEHIYVRFI